MRETVHFSKSVPFARVGRTTSIDRCHAPALYTASTGGATFQLKVKQHFLGQCHASPKDPTALWQELAYSPSQRLQRVLHAEDKRRTVLVKFFRAQR